MSYTIWCILSGEDSKFSVELDESKTVYDLTEGIKAKRSVELASVAANNLNLYRIDLKLGDGAGVPPLRDTVEMKMKELKEKGESPLRPIHKVRKYYPAELEDEVVQIFVQLPENLKRKRSDSNDRADISALLFHSKKRGTRHFTENTLTENKIQRQATDPPKFICDILEKLQAKRSTTREQLDSLKYFIGDSIVAAHFDLDASGNPCSNNEIKHYIGLSVKQTGSPLDRAPAKHVVICGYFQVIASYLCKCYPNRADFIHEAQWPLKFVAEIEENGKLCSYEPRTSFLFSLDTCPRINIAVCSDPANQHDRYRLLLQSGFLVRTINTINTQGSSFVSVAIYINNDLSAEWYLLYQPDRADPKIEYTRENFNLNSSLDNVRFFHRLYNFPSALSLDDKILDVETRLNGLKNEVDAKQLGGFTTPQPQRRKTETKAPPDGDHTHRFDNLSASQIVSKAGYQVIQEVLEGWAPLNPLPSTVCRARGPTNKDGRNVQNVIFKYVEQDEFDIHSFLLESKLAENHVIPILESFPCCEWKCIVMKEDLALRDAPTSLFKTAGYSLARQFLEGVGFIHHNLVAHLDLKPDNIVVGANTRLRIIDFGISVRVPLLESRIKGYQGTEGWVAPEVEQDPDAGYQAIRADLWSTGKVMRYFASRLPAHCSEIEFLADQLQNSEPQQRPLLSTISLDTLFSDHSDIKQIHH